MAPPHANPTAAFGTQIDGLSVAFDGTTSTAADGATIASYAWNFDDGETSTQPAPTHLYDAAGTYDVTLTVVDSLGASGSVTQPVTVAEASALAADEFQRTSASGWGTADVGGTWSTVSGSSVNGQRRVAEPHEQPDARHDPLGHPAVGHGCAAQRLDRQGRQRRWRARQRRASQDGCGRVPGEAAVLGDGRRERRRRAPGRHHRDPGRQPGPHRVHAHRGRHPRGAGAHGEHGSRRRPCR